MKILTIGSDRKLFELDSSVFFRVHEYASRTEESHVVVFTLKRQGYSLVQTDNLYLYPTNSLSRIHMVFDAIRIGKKIMQERNFSPGRDVLSSQDPFESGFVGWRLKKISGLALQMQIHTDVFSSYFKNTLFNHIRVFLTQFIIPKADSLRVVSQKVVTSLAEHIHHLPKKIDILPVFVDYDFIEKYVPVRDIKKEFPQFNFIICMVSRLTKEKRISDAISALAKVVKKFPHTGMIIAGEGPEKRRLQSLTETLGISHNVIFLGWQKDVISLYKTTNLFLSTSAYEGYGMSLVEASISGCPVITTPVGIAGELFQDGKNAFICRVDDVDCLSARIMTLIGDNALRQLFKAGLQGRMKDISLSREAYIQTYIRLCEETAKLTI